MNIKLEVCVDNLESFETAQQAGADRIELCGCLEVGGITPTAGFIQMAMRCAKVPVYVMIRPRQGDFLFSSAEAELMLADIAYARAQGADGVVIGALQADGNLDIDLIRAMKREAGDLGVTFHRAFDLCSEWPDALELLIEEGCERILSSGQALSAPAGAEVLRQMVQQSKGRISIMAGAGIDDSNVLAMVNHTGVREIHLSGKGYRQSRMSFIGRAKMGAVDDTRLNVTDFGKVAAVCQRVADIF